MEIAVSIVLVLGKCKWSSTKQNYLRTNIDIYIKGKHNKYIKQKFLIIENKLMATRNPKVFTLLASGVILRFENKREFHNKWQEFDNFIYRKQ